PEIDLSGSLGDFAESLAQLELQTDPDAKDLTPPERERKLIGIFEEKLAGLVNYLKSFTVAVTPDEPVNSLLYRILLLVIDGVRAKAGEWFTAVWALALFLIVRGFGTVFYFVIGAVAFSVFHILVASNFAQVTYEARNKELIEFL
ncbi:MAG: hypothetical protein AAB967_02390, partial [Patescibacteria group bacterium]